jgi:predicted transcriptional regulator
MDWIYAASRCGGRALNVGMAIWHLAQMKRTGSVAISATRIARAMGFDRTTASRALQALARAGLVTVDTPNGRNSLVTLHWPALVDSGMPVCSDQND